MGVRLIALDIDGTLLPYDGPHKGELSPRLRAAVTALVESGRTVVLASGRMRLGVMSMARELGLDTPFIAQEGCLTANANGEIVREITLDRELALAVSAYAREAGLEYEWFNADRYAVTKESPATKYYASLGEVTAECHPHPESLGIEPFGVGVLSGQDESSAVHRALVEQHGDDLHVLDFPFVTVATAPEASKGNALDLLARELGIAQPETLAMGDSVNDASMLAWAGRGIATAKADRYALAAADEVLPDEEDAVAKVLESLL